MKTLFKNMILGNLFWLALTALTVSNLFFDRGVTNIDNQDWEWAIAIISSTMLCLTTFAKNAMESLFKSIFNY